MTVSSEYDFCDASGSPQIASRHSELFLKTQIIYFGLRRKREPLQKYSPGVAYT